MGDKTKIQWCDATWNPVTGCSPVSEGCLNCYAKAMWERFHKEPFSEIKIYPERLSQPYNWEKPRRIFIVSMGDLFHEEVPWTFIDEIISVIEGTPRHEYFLLTKRPVQMKEYFEQMGVPDNVWLGVTVENSNERIPILLSIPAAKRFVSIEPILESMSFRWVKWHNYFPEGWRERKEVQNHLDGIKNINWIICGAESGPGRRPCNIEWVRALKNECVEAGVPFFYKQGIGDDGRWTKMPTLDGQTWNEVGQC